MKKPISVIVFALFAVAAAAVIISPPAVHALWYGVDISDRLDDVSSEQLHAFIESNAAPQLNISPFENAGNNPEDDVGTTIHTEEAWDGYTLLNAFGGYATGVTVRVCPFPIPFCVQEIVHEAVLIDMEGNRVNSWDFVMMGLPAKMLPNGDVMGGGPPGFMEGVVTQLDWDGNFVKSWGSQHHDHQREGNPVGYYAPGMDAMTDGGITMWLDRELVTDPAIRAATAPNGNELEDDVIFQADWNGSIVFSWHAVDHFFGDDTGDLGMGFDANAKEAIMNGPWINGIEGGFDYTHNNCVSWLGPNRHFDQAKGGKDYRFHPENIIFDSRTMNILAIIARYDHPEGEFKSGDIVWRVGPDYSADKPEYKVGQIIGPHHTHMVPKTLPGGGNIMVFDNGGMAGFGSYFRDMKAADGGPIGTYPNTFRGFSRIVEFDPVTLQVVWQYINARATDDYDGNGNIEGNEREFFAPYYSSAQRLHNGNTLITEGNSGRVLEVTPDGDVAWEYINEFDSGFFGNMLYRAYRVPRSWVENAMYGPEE